MVAAECTQLLVITQITVRNRFGLVIGLCTVQFCPFFIFYFDDVYQVYPAFVIHGPWVLSFWLSSGRFPLTFARPSQY